MYVVLDPDNGLAISASAKKDLNSHGSAGAYRARNKVYLVRSLQPKVRDVRIRKRKQSAMEISWQAGCAADDAPIHPRVLSIYQDLRDSAYR